MTDDRMICLTIVKSFTNVTRILAHGILFTHTHTHTDMTNDRMICLTIVRSFRDVTQILAHGISLSHTHTRTWQMTECRAANQYGISVFCTDFTCKIREYEFGLENTEIELCQFCHLNYCCQNKAYLFWVANQSGFVAFYALEPSNTSLITKTFNLLS